MSSSRKTENLKRLKNADFFPDDCIRIYEKDYDELLQEEIEEKKFLKNSLKDRIFNLFENGYNSEHIENLIFTRLAQKSIDLKST